LVDQEDSEDLAVEDLVVDEGKRKITIWVGKFE